MTRLVPRAYTRLEQSKQGPDELWWHLLLSLPQIGKHLMPPRSVSVSRNAGIVERSLLRIKIRIGPDKTVLMPDLQLSRLDKFHQ